MYVRKQCAVESLRKNAASSFPGADKSSSMARRPNRETAEVHGQVQGGLCSNHRNIHVYIIYDLHRVRRTRAVAPSHASMSDLRIFCVIFIHSVSLICRYALVPDFRAVTVHNCLYHVPESWLGNQLYHRRRTCRANNLFRANDDAELYGKPPVL